MRLFAPLTHNKDLKDYFLERIGNINHPRSRRYARRYTLDHPPTDLTVPANIENLIGFARNRFASVATGYKHGKHRYVWIKKEVYEEGPWTTKNEPYDTEAYRKVLLLNRVDLFIQTVLAHMLRKALRSLGSMTKVRNRTEILSATRDLILRAQAADRKCYLKTDIEKFVETFDIEKALLTMVEALATKMDSEDRQLLLNVYDSFKEKVVQSRCSGSPVVQLLGEWTLNRFDQAVRESDPSLFDSFYIRNGEDIVCTLRTEEECNVLYNQLREMTRKCLGCDLHPLSELHTVHNKALGKDVPYSQTKSVVGRFKEYPLEHCGYEYALRSRNMVITLRLSTFEKIKARIADYTDGKSIRYPDLEELAGNRDIKRRIRKLNNFLGFYSDGTRWTFSPHLGINELFRLPADMDDTALREQASRVNHYMLRRLRHLHLRDIPNNRGGRRSFREAVDKRYREMGLRTLIDGINKMKRRLPRA